MIVSNIFSIIIFNLLFTIFVEFSFSIILKISKDNLLNIIFINLITNPIVNAIMLLVDSIFNLNIILRWIIIFFLEIITIFSEKVLFNKYLNIKINMLYFSLVLNISSFGLGLLFYMWYL